MPDTGFDREVVKAGTALSKEVSLYGDEFLTSEHAERIIDEFDLKLVGSGAECVVLQSRNDQKKGEKVVAAITYQDMNPEKMRRIFYLHRIMATLFPHNFPHFSSAFGKHPVQENIRNISGTKRQEIVGPAGNELQAISPEMHEFRWREVENTSQFPFSKVKEAVDTLGLPVDFDDAGDNFALGEDDGVYYLDKIIYNPKDITLWDTNKISSYMKIKGYSERDTRIVRKSIERLKAL